MVSARSLRDEFVSEDLTEPLSGIVAKVRGFHPFILLSSDKGTDGHVCVRFLLHQRSRVDKLRLTLLEFISIRIVYKRIKCFCFFKMSSAMFTM